MKNIFTISLVIAAIVFTPLYWGGVARVSALSLDNLIGGLTGAGGETVRIISDTSETAITNALKSTLSEISNAITAGELTSLNLKETVLDPIAWNMSKQLQQQLTGELLKWLGGQGEGQNGEIPFIQNYSDHYEKIKDEIAGDYIFGDEISGLCSEEEDFIVKEKVYNDYIKSKNYGQAAFQCIDGEAVGTESVLDRMAYKIASCNTVICAQYAARKELAKRQLQAIENEKFINELSGGMKVSKVCGTVESSGGSEKKCQIVNPLYLGRDATSFMLTELPGLQLLNMDEFNEVASNLMNNLTNQALQGLTGVLGLSGNPNYGSNIFGQNGNLSYADALAQDDVSQYQSGGINPLTNALSVENKYLSLQVEILNSIQALEVEMESNRDTSSCSSTELTTELANIKRDSEINITTANTTLTILNSLNEQFAATTDSNIKSAITSAYMELKTNDLLHSDYDNRKLEIEFIDITLANLIEQFKYDNRPCAGEPRNSGGD